MNRLLIIAEHSLVVHAIRVALRQTTGFEIVACVDGRVSACCALQEHCPDVVLVDDMNRHALALARVREASEHAPEAKVIVLTAQMDDARISDAFEAGAHSVLAKCMHPVGFATMLREVVRGNVVHRYERPAAPEADISPLTSRELEILRLAAEGSTNGQIARMLWVTEQTVKFHLSNTYRKLGVANRTEASRYAHVHALVEAPERLAMSSR